VLERSTIPSKRKQAGGVLRRRSVAAGVRDALSSVHDERLHSLPFTVRFWDGSEIEGAAQPGESDRPDVTVRSPQAINYILRATNQLGLARAFVTGAVDVDGDLEDVLALREQFRDVSLTSSERLRAAACVLRLLGARILRPAPVPAIEARRRGRLHSLARDRQSVQHHYDVSNRFYRIVLGPSMTYSCAYFESKTNTLEEAQERKHDLIARKLQLTRGERLLDIGCGWGSLLLHAVGRYGVRGVGVTLSEAQAELARQRVCEAGLADMIEIRVADYRELDDGPFDKIVSVGMYEHLGRTELDRYASTVARLLRPGGLFLNHGITRQQFSPTGPGEFISRYIFPDGDLHPVTFIMQSMQSAGLEVRDVESLREHYPLTLRRWVANLKAGRTEAVAEVGLQRERAWRLYMSGSALAFDAGEISVYQVLSARAGQPHRLPLDRSELLAPKRQPEEVIEHAR
jgi:cyclopropane-fatty-acyl-phospholipid synthase